MSPTIEQSPGDLAHRNKKRYLFLAGKVCFCVFVLEKKRLWTPSQYGQCMVLLDSIVRYRSLRRILISMLYILYIEYLTYYVNSVQ